MIAFRFPTRDRTCVAVSGGGNPMPDDRRGPVYPMASDAT